MQLYIERLTHVLPVNTGSALIERRKFQKKMLTSLNRVFNFIIEWIVIGTNSFNPLSSIAQPLKQRIFHRDY